MTYAACMFTTGMIVLVALGACALWAGFGFLEALCSGLVKFAESLEVLLFKIGTDWIHLRNTNEMSKLNLLKETRKFELLEEHWQFQIRRRRHVKDEEEAYSESRRALLDRSE